MTANLEKFFEEFPELKGTILEEILRRMQDFHYAQTGVGNFNRYRWALEEIKKKCLNAIVEISDNGGKNKMQESEGHFKMIGFIKFLLAEEENILVEKENLSPGAETEKAV